MIADGAPKLVERDADLAPAALRLFAGGGAEPRFKLRDGIRVQRRAVKRAAPVVFAEIGRGSCHIPRNAVRPSSRMNTANASRRPLPMRTRVSLAVANSIKSRSRHGVMVNQMPAMTST